jgi:ribosome biogenesis GTPase A
MAQNPIQWFPGHMAKTRRMMSESLGSVDIVLELIDSRIPYSSRNPEIKKLVGEKPHLTILTKASLADPDMSKEWLDYFKSKNEHATLIDSTDGLGIKSLNDAIRSALADKLERYALKGMEGRHIKAMIVGIPNVGKSSLINRLAGAKKARVEDRPGVTVNKQWVSTDIGIDLLDMPGVLWPKFEDERVGQNLAMTGAIRDKILDTEEIAMILAKRLMECAPDKFLARYKLTEEETEYLDGYDLFELVAKKRGMLMSGGQINSARCAEMLLDEFRGAVIGRITLESPEEVR